MSDLEQSPLHTKDCDICYLKKDMDDFFHLECCRNYSICKTCVELLLQPKCPFCRLDLKNIPPTSRAHRSTSITTSDEFFRPVVEPISFLDDHIESFDDTYMYSRIYRRRMRRYTKLRQRELMAIRNRQRNATYNSQNRKKKREIQREIKDGISDYKKKKKRVRRKEDFS